MGNKIGKRGESIFATIISRNIGSRGFLLDPTFLGDKFPTVDFHVSLLEYPFKGFFYASVKTTTMGYYLIGANGLDNYKNINGLVTKYPVDGANIEQLWKEVAEYWDNSRKMTKFVSSFN